MDLPPISHRREPSGAPSGGFAPIGSDGQFRTSAPLPAENMGGALHVPSGLYPSPGYMGGGGEMLKSPKPPSESTASPWMPISASMASWMLDTPDSLATGWAGSMRCMSSWAAMTHITTTLMRSVDGPIAVVLVR